jgi:hypothetical protein
MVLDNDRQAILLALASAHRVDVETAHIARIKNTKDVEYLWVSEPMIPELEASGTVEFLTEPKEIAFDANGMFIDEEYA